MSKYKLWGVALVLLTALAAGGAYGSAPRSVQAQARIEALASPAGAVGAWALLQQAPQPQGPGGDLGQQVQDQVSRWVAGLQDKANAESDRLQNGLKQALQQQEDQAVQSAKDRARAELQKLVNQICGGGAAGSILAGLGLALRWRARKGGG